MVLQTTSLLGCEALGDTRFQQEIERALVAAGFVPSSMDDGDTWLSFSGSWVAIQGPVGLGSRLAVGLSKEHHVRVPLIVVTAQASAPGNLLTLDYSFHASLADETGAMKPLSVEVDPGLLHSEDTEAASTPWDDDDMARALGDYGGEVDLSLMRAAGRTEPFEGWRYAVYLRPAPALSPRLEALAERIGRATAWSATREGERWVVRVETADGKQLSYLKAEEYEALVDVVGAPGAGAGAG